MRGMKKQKWGNRTVTSSGVCFFFPTENEKALFNRHLLRENISMSPPCVWRMRKGKMKGKVAKAKKKKKDQGNFVVVRNKNKEQQTLRITEEKWQRNRRGNVGSSYWSPCISRLFIKTCKEKYSKTILN